MGFIEIKEGCSINSTHACWGPRGSYVTFLGTELKLLIFHFIFSLFLGLILIGILSYMKRKGKVSMPYWKILIFSLVIVVLLFVLLAIIFPIKMIY